MKIIIINGSPKGNKSTVIPYIDFIKLQFEEHDYSELNIAQNIYRVSNNKDYFNEIMETIEGADGIIWIFPVYVYLVHSHLIKFFEIIFNSDRKKIFDNKYTISLSVSNHIFDNIAVNYMHSICDDLNMKFYDFFSIRMYDLVKKDTRKQLTFFLESFFYTIINKKPIVKMYPPFVKKKFTYNPTGNGVLKVTNKNILLLTDLTGPDSNLGKMIGYIKKIFNGKLDVLNINDIHIKCGCFGCLQCGYEHKCRYHNTDDFFDVYEKKVINADILFFGARIENRFLTSRFKMFFERSYYCTHKHVLKNKQIVFLFSGHYFQNSILQDFLQGIVELQTANLAGVITDETADSALLDELLYTIAERVIEYSNTGFIKGETFLGVGPRILFRDNRWKYRMVFQADYRFMKKHKKFDWPYKNRLENFRSLILLILTKIPGFRKEFQKGIILEIVKPLKKIIMKLKREGRENY